MNSALVSFVAEYLANHAARSDAGEGVLGRVQVDDRRRHQEGVETP